MGSLEGGSRQPGPLGGSPVCCPRGHSVLGAGGGAGAPTHPTVPLSLILASSMAKVMWSWCSMPRATRLNATWRQGRQRAVTTAPALENAPPRPAPSAPPGQAAGPRCTWNRSLVMVDRRWVWSVTPFRLGFSYRTLW